MVQGSKHSTGFWLTLTTYFKVNAREISHVTFNDVTIVTQLMTR